MSPEQPEPVPPCPKCKSGCGVPYSVTAGTGHVLVMLRCDSCQHTWAIERQEDPDPLGHPL